MPVGVFLFIAGLEIFFLVGGVLVLFVFLILRLVGMFR